MFSYGLYEGTSLPNKPDDFEVERPAPKKNLDGLNVADVAAKLKQYAKLDVDKQVNVLAGVRNMLNKCIELLEKRSTRFQFDLDFSITIFHLLPKLPASASVLKKLTQLLLERMVVLTNDEELKYKPAISILSAFAKLSLDIPAHREFIIKLIATLEALSRRVPYADTSVLSELWLFLAYARAREYNNNKVIALYESVNTELATRARGIVTSKLQRRIDDTLSELLSTTAEEDYESELPIGSYSMDVAFPSYLLNIEIDGPQHYREDDILSRASRFRDFILRSMGWEVIRISHLEWEANTTKQDKKDYLLGKLVKHTGILSEAALSRFKYLKLDVKKKVDLMEANAASAIPVGQPEHKDVDDSEIVKREPATNRFLTSARYLNEVFAGKLAHKRYAAVIGKTEVRWKQVSVDDNTFFCLKKIKVKAKNRAGFERVADAADLTLKFEKSESSPGQYKLLVSKASTGLLRANQLISMGRFFNHGDKDNGSGKVVHLIREYEQGDRLGLG
jgi:very-short-patch-repair endonuclease